MKLREARSRLRRTLGSSWVTRWLWIAALALALPALCLGHVLDDLQQQSMLKGTYDSVARTGAELYCFSRGPGEGIDPAILSWWDHPDSGLCFLRPISSWSLWIDHAWLWRLPALTHLHSVLWFLALWLAWRAILLRYLPADVANLGLLLTAASGSISMTTAWIAARHALVGGCFGVWGLYHCLRSRDPAAPVSGRPSLRELCGWVLIAVGLLASEMVLGVFGFLVAREWLARSPAGARQPGWLARIAGYAGCGVVYVGAHAAMGYGAPKYPLYLNPSSDPLTFLRAVPERLLGLAGDLVLGVPAESWLYPSLTPALAAVSVLAVAALVAAVVALRREAPEDLWQTLLWLGLGALLSLAPCISGMQGGRSLTIAGFPLFAIIAAGILLLPRATSDDVKPRSALRGPLRSMALAIGGIAPALRGGAMWMLAAGAFIGNPAAHVGWYAILEGLDRAGPKGFDARKVSCPPRADVYLVDASQSGASAWYARYWLKDRLGARNYRQLTMTPIGVERIELSRTGPSSLTLRGIGGPLVGEMAIPPGSEGFIQPGFARTYDDYSVLVTRVSKRGPSEVAFDFSRALDEPELCLFVHDDVGLYQLRPPAIGRSQVIIPGSALNDLLEWFPFEGIAGAHVLLHRRCERSCVQHLRVRRADL
jgi:hypothetical protein